MTPKPRTHNDGPDGGPSTGELTIVLADRGDAPGEGLAEAISTMDGAQWEAITVFVDHPRYRIAEIAAISAELASFSALRLVNIIWSCREWAPDNLQPLVSLYQSCARLRLDYRVNLVVPLDTDYFVQRTDELTPVNMLLQTSRGLQAQGIGVRWLLSIHRDLLFRIEPLYCLARDEQAEPLLVFPEHVGAEPGNDKLTSDEQLFAWDFVKYRLLDSDRVLLASRQRDYYRWLVKYLGGTNRQWETSQIADASCGMRQLALDVCPSDDQPGERWRDLIAFAGDVSSVLLDALRAYWQRAWVRASTIKTIRGDERFNRVLLIGAYGGEHIGDAAILGGVLCRIHERFGTTEAILMTQRKNHTSHLMPMLDVPVEVTVDEYERGPIRHHLHRVDAVVFAGGPLVDIPKQLVRHLYTVSLAHRLGKPFVAEGIGPGPFTRSPSWFTARRMVELAGYISVRTSESARHKVVKDLNVQIGQCPAFDYLATRSNGLTRLPNIECGVIDRLLADTEGRPIIGINIRPIGHLHTIGAPDNDLAGYTRHIEDRFEKRLAEGMREFDRISTRKPCYIYFPMNAIQFGSSDILSAYRIRRALGSGVDFRVWQADASLDGVVALLRRVDVAITMRFHATIFALSQGCRVIGVDYRIGKRDKVVELLEDLGQGENCQRIDMLTSEWLLERLNLLTENAAPETNLIQ